MKKLFCFIRNLLRCDNQSYHINVSKDHSYRIVDTKAIEKANTFKVDYQAP